MTCRAKVVFQLFTARGALPVKQAKVTVTDRVQKTEVIEYTDDAGKTREILLEVPGKELTRSPSATIKPYSIYDAQVEVEGYVPIKVRGMQLFGGVINIQRLGMKPFPISKGMPEERYEIPDHTLVLETSRKREMMQTGGMFSNLLSYVHIPAYITVHMGRPEEHSAKNLTVSFLEYIKNVACSELYPTWPLAAIQANIYAEISLVLYRLYTNWYPGRGYDFDITNQVSMDQAYVAGRTLYNTISQMAEQCIGKYVRQINSSIPYFAEYGEGGEISCIGLSKWGTVRLAEQGKTAMEILEYYYGTDIEVVQTNIVEEIGSLYPGYVLEKGTISPSVITLERFLNRIHGHFPSIPMILEMDSRFTEEVEQAVRSFQTEFLMKRTGKVKEAVWNRIASVIYAIVQVEEINEERQMQPIPNIPPSVLLRQGSRGIYVRLAQYFMKVIACFYEEIRPVKVDGIFGKETKKTLLDIQREFELSPDGILGPMTWDQLYNVYLGITIVIGFAIPYPGYLVKRGTSGENVYLMQEYLKAIGERINFPKIDLDGFFGPGMEAAVIAFQELFGLEADGMIGQQTWQRIVSIRRLL